MGAAGFALTDLGKVTLEFLFTTFRQYELTPFQSLDKFLEESKQVKSHFDIVYKLVSDFEIYLGRTGKEMATEIVPFFEKLGVGKPSVPEHTAFGLYFGWMENLREDDIESEYKVYANQIPEVAKEIVKLLDVYEALAKKRNMGIPANFAILKDRLTYGVREEELPFVKLSGIGRDTARALYAFGCDTLAVAPFDYKGTLIEKLCRNKEEYGAAATLALLQKIPRIVDKRSRKILDLVQASTSPKGKRGSKR
jgi:hypothetical protein